MLLATLAATAFGFVWELLILAPALVAEAQVFVLPVEQLFDSICIVFLLHYVLALWAHPVAILRCNVGTTQALHMVPAHGCGGCRRGAGCGKHAHLIRPCGWARE